MIKRVRQSLGNPRLRKFFRWLAWGSAGLFCFGVITLGITYSFLSRDADQFVTYFALRSPKTLSKVLDRNGDVIGIFAEEHRVIIPYGDIPKAFINAVVATEDADFWSHGGVTARGVLRSAWTFTTSFGQRKEGFSTLTMQLVRTVTNKRERRLLAGGVKRKLQEIAIARKLEGAYTKKQIFEQYANEVYFGGGRYGIEAAAQFYFGKSAPQLNVEECALLAGLVQNPNWYNPYNPEPKARAAAKNRRNHVLLRMVSENYLKPADAKVLLERPIRLARENAQEEAIAPYAVEEVRKILYEKYGKDKVLTGGLEVYTTIDSVWQQAANEAVKKGLKAAERRRGFRKDAVQFVNDPETTQLPGWRRFFEGGESVRGVILGWKDKKAQVRIGKSLVIVPEEAFAWAGKPALATLQRGAAPLFLVKEADESGAPTKLELDQEPEVEGALLAADPRTGEIRAMVGGYDFNRSKFNRSWQAERQVGSTMKAFVYGAAFEQGKTPATLVNDAPVKYKFEVNQYEPQNYDREFWGPLPIWEAVRDSRNVCAVRTLESIGAPSGVEFAHKCGVSGYIAAYPSMALGAADLGLKEMVRAYGTFANEGKQAPPLFLIKKIVDRDGQVLESHEGQMGEQVVDPQSNYQLVQCLQGVAQAGTGSRCNELNWPVAGKTGTTDGHTDCWYLGFSTRIACGVWVGLDTKKLIFRGADGGKVAVPIWVDFMKTALPTTPREEFNVPEGMEWVDIDRLTGLRATSATTDRILHLAFKPGTAPKDASTNDAIQKIREAKDKAARQAVEYRTWGVTESASQPAAPAPEWKEDPNG